MDFKKIYESTQSLKEYTFPKQDNPAWKELQMKYDGVAQELGIELSRENVEELDMYAQEFEEEGANYDEMTIEDFVGNEIVYICDRWLQEHGEEDTVEAYAKEKKTHGEDLL